jgi:2-(1,2-epoxy-1,2-dihydrophenyl)acetyl-CoA isomerase
LAENVLAAVARDFTDFTATVGEYIDGDDVVCAIGRYGGTASETGTPLDIHFVHVLRFAPDGKIARLQEHPDTYTMRHALGR